jgi:hypothetical protein
MGGGDDFLGHVFVGVMFLGVKVGKKNENEGGGALWLGCGGLQPKTRSIASLRGPPRFGQQTSRIEGRLKPPPSKKYPIL